MNVDKFFGPPVIFIVKINLAILMGIGGLKVFLCLLDMFFWPLIVMIEESIKHKSWITPAPIRIDNDFIIYLSCFCVGLFGMLLMSISGTLIEIKDNISDRKN
jgi:hypothetical protein